MNLTNSGVPTETKTTLNCLATYLHMSDNANLLDIEQGGKKRRLGRYLMETSAARLSSICSLQMLLLLGRKTNAAAVEAAKGQV